MKIKLLIPLFVVISAGALAQVPTGTISFEDNEFNTYFLTRAKLPIVKGKVLNLTAEEIKKTQLRYSIVTPFEKLQLTKIATLNPDGTFELILDYAFPYQQIWLSVGELFYTGVYANTDLYLEVDARSLRGKKDAAFNDDGVKYLGTDGALNTYINNHTLYKRGRQLELDAEAQKTIAKLMSARVSDLNYPVYIRKYDSLFTLLTQLDKEYAEQQTNDFSWVIKNERLSQYYGNLCTVHWGKQMPTMVFDKVKGHKAYLTSNHGMLFYNYLLNYLNNPIPSKNSPGVGANTLRVIKKLDSLFTPAKADFLKLRLSSKDPVEQKAIMETVVAHLKTEWCKQVIRSEQNKLWQKLKSLNTFLDGSKSFVSNNHLGKPIAELSFGAKLYKADSTTGKTLLLNLTKSFEQKALLIDIWATWCGPCLAEFPHSKTLRESTKDLPIEFVYICTSEGSDFEKWKTKIAEFELSGTHIYADKKLVNELMEMFSGSGYPTYALLNTKGEYKTSAVRPSSVDKEKLSELIK